KLSSHFKGQGTRLPSCSYSTRTFRENMRKIPDLRAYCAGGGAASGEPSGDPVSPFTRSFSSLLGLKKGIFFAGTSTRSPVLGLRPMRGLRCRVRKLPKPGILFFSPARTEPTGLA